MKCPRCERANPPSSKFCLECGAHLAARCPSCGTELPARARFCNECGHALAAAPSWEPRLAAPESYTPRHLAERILTTRSALEGERKQVTVLFVDVSGFTRMSERLDPEDVHGLMRRAFELMLEAVHRYEGTVNQFLGDGIMALFGAPLAHEDHPRRAVNAALAIRAALDDYRHELTRRHGITFEVRQGLNTGLVVVGSIGTDLRMDYTAVGDTTNVAARLQQAADRGRILLSAATWRLVEGYCHARPLGPLSLKGKADPVAAWEVVAARQERTRLDVAAERGLTPLVGRARELDRLREAFDRTRAGHGQVMFVVGEAGIGKSRLLHEFHQTLEDEATWLEGRCVPYGRGIALHPVIDMLKRTFRVEEGDSEAGIARKIDRGVLRLGEDLRPLLPAFRHLLSIDPGDSALVSLHPRERRAEIFDALRRLLVRASEVRPQVQVFEDVHWMDQATGESLLFIADSIPRNRILQVLTYRPGWIHPFEERTYHARVVLDALSAEESRRMTESLLAAGRLPEELAGLVVRKAEGNPFFVEEVVRSLQEVGALRLTGAGYVLTRPLDEIVIPDTVQDVIMARIDRLAEEPKRALQLASVIGREFTRRLLDQIADSGDRTELWLRELKALELIYEKSVFPELAYMFKHALTHEVTYNSLLIQRRKDLHGMIARAVEQLYADRLPEHYEVLAHHYARAEEWGKALEYLEWAADKAARAYANREAIGFLEQALAVAARPELGVDLGRRVAIHRQKAELHMGLSDFLTGRAEWQRVLDLAREAGDRTGEVVALGAMSFASTFAHDFDLAVEQAHAAIGAGTDGNVEQVLAPAHLTLGIVHAVTGRLVEAPPEMGRALAIARRAGYAPTQSLSLTLSGMLRNWEADWAQAFPLQAEGHRIAREHNLLIPLLQNHFAQGVALTGAGRYDEGQAIIEGGLALALKVGDEIHHHRLLNTLGWLRADLGDLAGALELNRRGAEGGRKRGDAETASNAELNMADIYLTRGDLSAAGELLDGVRRVVGDPATSEWMKWRYSIRLFAGLAAFSLARGDPQSARGFAERVLEAATRTRSRKYVVRGWRLVGEIAAARRRWDEAEAALRQALPLAETIANPPELWRTQAALARLRVTQGDRPQAARAYQAARGVVDRVASGLADESLRASLFRLPLVEEIRRGAAGERVS